MDRWDEEKDHDPTRIARSSQPPVLKTSVPSPTKTLPGKKVDSRQLLRHEQLQLQSQHSLEEINPQCHMLPQCNGYDSCVPGLALLSDSEDSSFTSCGTEEFFDFEDISNALNLMESWNNCNNGSNHMPRRSVRFGRAVVREYALTVGDHPICQDGLALSLDWNHADEKVYDIDDYEYHRHRKNLRKGSKRKTNRLDYWQRREILQRVGSFSNKELSRIEREQSQRSVAEYLDGGGFDMMGPLDDEREDSYEKGVELLEMEPEEEDDLSGSFPRDVCFESEWQMKVQVLDD
jgi:hypothetical protein